MTKTNAFTAAGDILKQLIVQYGLEGPMAEHQLREGWADIVGKSIAAHAQPEQIRYHRLYLAVDSPAWMQELSFLKTPLLEKVNEALARFQTNLDKKYRVDEIILRMSPPSSAPPAAGGPRKRP